MPITVVASTGSIGNQSSATTLGITVAGGTIDPGDLIVVYIAADNAGTAGASSISSVTDNASGGSNTYTQLRLQNRTAASAVSDGCTCAIYGSTAARALVNGNTITVNFSPATTAKAAAYRVFEGAGATTGTPVSSSGSAATYTTTATASLAVDQLIVAAAANESNTPPAADGDTTGGAWVEATANSGGSGSDLTKMGLRYAYKIITSAGAQTFNGNNGATTDWAACAAMYNPFVQPILQGVTRARVPWTPMP